MQHPQFEVLDGRRRQNGNGEVGFAESAANGLWTKQPPAAIIDPTTEAMSFHEPEPACSDSEAFSNAIRTQLGHFDPVELRRLETTAMADRIDTKFLLTPDQLLSCLELLRDSHRVLEIKSVRLHRYRTLYFDTSGFDFYLRHHNGGRNSYKVRSRQYLDSGLSFLEIKKKISSNRSVKTRTETPAFVTRMTLDTDRFIEANSPVEARRLEPTLCNSFDRITLLSKTGPERLTLDVHLVYRNEAGRVTLPGMAIAELKQEDMDRASIVFRHMSSLRVRPTGFSKYCIGVPMLNPHVRHNRIRPKLRMIRKLSQGGSNGS